MKEQPNTTKKPDIKITALVIYPHQTAETISFYCRVLVNGEHFCSVKNNGQGGENDYEISGEKLWDVVPLLDAEIAKHYPPAFEELNGERFPYPADLDSVITSLVYEETALRK